MTRIRFEDLPSTNTPRNAENLNKLNNVVISTTEPTTGEEVWVQKGKNLFDKNSMVYSNQAYLPGDINSTQIKDYNSIGTYILIIKLLEGETYTISKRAGGRFRAGFTNIENPALNTDNVITLRLNNNDTGTSMTFTVPTGSPYFVCNYYSSDQTADTSVGYDNILNSIQIEEGSIATSYEPYIDKKIYTKNNNDVYDKFYEEGYAPNGFYSLGEGAANTPTNSGKLIVKKVNNLEAPNNGVILQYGNSTSWNGQLYIGDNSEQGVWYNGWSNGVRGTWKQLDFKKDDTGWIDASQYINTTYFAARSGYTPAYRKIGNQVFWRGEVYCHTAPNSSQESILTNLPSSIMPYLQHTGAGQQYEIGTTYAIWMGANSVIIRNQNNIVATYDYQGYALSNLSTYLTD